MAPATTYDDGAFGPWFRGGVRARLPLGRWAFDASLGFVNLWIGKNITVDQYTPRPSEVLRGSGVVAASLGLAASYRF